MLCAVSRGAEFSVACALDHRDNQAQRVLDQNLLGFLVEFRNGSELEDVG
jgi:hypothetical protein